MSDVPDDAPEHCPGTESENAGKAQSCQGCPNQSICSSGAAQGPDPYINLIKDRLKNVHHKILVLSGKGGVGKSTFSTCLARGLACDESKQVALMDIDICGPSIPTMLGLEGETVHGSGSGWSPVFIEDNLCVMSVGFLLESPDEAVIWRGAKKTTLIRQFLTDVDWGDDVDYLVIDTPPGTSDEHLSITKYLKEAGVTGAVLVTTPQEVAVQDVRKEINFCRKVSLPIIGLVENMAGFVCPNCDKASNIFDMSSGGGEKLAADLTIPFLGRLPLDARVGKCCDEGKSIFENLENTPAVNAYNDITKKVKEYCANTCL